jgi:hypothetical protein
MPSLSRVVGRPGSGSVIAQSYRRHRHQEFLRFLKLIGTAVPAGHDLHVVLDSYATHKTLAVHKWLLRHPRRRGGRRGPRANDVHDGHPHIAAASKYLTAGCARPCR